MNKLFAQAFNIFNVSIKAINAEAVIFTRKETGGFRKPSKICHNNGKVL